MKKILAFGGSNSSSSINQQLVKATAKLIDFAQVDVVSLRDFEVDLFGVDIEAEKGIPEKMQQLHALIGQYDAYIISTPEHNGIPPAFLLNIIDWLSRIDRTIFGNKPTLLMSTSPGARAGVSALAILEANLPRFGTDVSGVYSLPSFRQNFEGGEVVNPEELAKLNLQLNCLELKLQTAKSN